MKKYKLILLYLLTLATSQAIAFQVEPEIVEFLKAKLNSERIAYLFGSDGVETLDINSPVFPENRISSLHSLHDGVKIMRTLAVVDFIKPLHSDLQDAHYEIVSGKSIGTVLQSYGWKIKKVPIYFSVISLSPNLRLWMHESKQDQAALHIYKLEISKENFSGKIHYCTILEVHSSQYLTSECLQALNADQYDDFKEKTNEIDLLLIRCRQLLTTFLLPRIIPIKPPLPKNERLK